MGHKQLQLKQAPEPTRLDLRGGEAHVRTTIRSWAAAALGAGTSPELKRTVIECLLDMGLRQGPDSSYELHAVLTAQLGVAVNKAVEGNRKLQALYNSPGHKLATLLEALSSAGLVINMFVGPKKVKHTAMERGWLLQHAGPAQGPAAPKPAQLPLQISLPPAAGPPAAASASNGGGAVPSWQEFDLAAFDSFSGRPSISATVAVFQLTKAVGKFLRGVTNVSTDIRSYAIGTLLRQGMSKVGSGSCFRQVAVSASDAEHALLCSVRQEVEAGSKPAALLDSFQQQYSGSLLTVFQDPACKQLVRVETVGGRHHLLLLLDRLAAGQLPVTAWRTAPVPPPPSAAANGWASVSAAVPSSGPTTPEVTAQLGALHLGGSSGASGSSGAHTAVSTFLPAAQLVATEAEAAAAVAVLSGAAEVAMDCEGALERDGSISLIQLYAPAADLTRCFVFDLHAMGPEVRAAAMRQLGQLLESPDTIKVLHDCRADCEALFYLHGIRLSPVWDTQVAFGLLQFVSSVGGSGVADGVNAPIGLNPLLQQYGLPLNPLKKVMHARMDREPQLFERRPIEEQVLQYAVADVWQLLPAKVLLEADLGPAATAQVDALSAAYSEWCLEPADRRHCAAGAAGGAGPGGGSYAAAVRLPLGKDMRLSIDPPDYRPRYSPALVDAGVTVDDGDDDDGEEQQGEGAKATPLPRAGEDEGTRQMLELFPDHVQAAILDRLAAEEQAEAEAVAAAAAEAAAVGEAAGEPGHGGSGSGAGSGGKAAAGTNGNGNGSTGSTRVPVQLVEVIVDLGRPVRVRLASRQELRLEVEFSVEDALSYLATAKGRLHLGDASHSDIFYSDNRAGIAGTLHRVSAMRDRQGGIIGLTYRVGRHVPGVGRLILDILHALSQGHDAAGHEVQGAVSPSLLLLGGPGMGKTTLLRDVAHILSDTFHRQLVIVDTSNEVAGDSSVTHDCIGGARRMMVRDRRHQHDTMIEAVQNHNPDVVVIDEIGSTKEVTAAKSIAHRGVVLVGTAHGRSLDALMRNGELNGLIGGITGVTLGDADAKQLNNGVKTRKERGGDPAFSTLIEVESRNRWRVHMSVARSVDAILAGREPTTQLRWVGPDGQLMVRLEGQPAGTSSGAGGMRAALAEAAGKLGKKGRWFQGLLELAAQY